MSELWLIPSTDISIGEGWAHINDDGLPRCGVELSHPHTPAMYRNCFMRCPVCDGAQASGQMGLFDKQIVEDKR